MMFSYQLLYQLIGKSHDLTLKSLCIFPVLMVLYLPVAAVGYSLLGSNLSDNILDTLKAHPTWMYYLVQVLICLHLLSAFTIVINPLCQGVEKLFKVPPRELTLFIVSPNTK